MLVKVGGKAAHFETFFTGSITATSIAGVRKLVPVGNRLIQSLYTRLRMKGGCLVVKIGVNPIHYETSSRYRQHRLDRRRSERGSSFRVGRRTTGTDSSACTAGVASGRGVRAPGRFLPERVYLHSARRSTTLHEKAKARTPATRSQIPHAPSRCQEDHRRRRRWRRRRRRLSQRRRGGQPWVATSVH